MSTTDLYSLEFRIALEECIVTYLNTMKNINRK